MDFMKIDVDEDAERIKRYYKRMEKEIYSDYKMNPYPRPEPVLDENDKLEDIEFDVLVKGIFGDEAVPLDRTISSSEEVSLSSEKTLPSSESASPSSESAASRSESESPSLVCHVVDSKYSIPNSKDIDVYSNTLKSLSDDRLLSAIQSLVSKKDSTKKKPYIEIRNLNYAVNFELTERKLLAPAFRTFRRLKKHSRLNRDERLLSLDRQVFDLHYIYRNYRSLVVPTEEKYRDLFLGDEFDFPLAFEYASEKWTSVTKIDLSLMLPEHIQMELAVFSHKHTKEKYRNVLSQSKSMRQKLMNHVLSATSRLKEEAVPEYVNDFKCLKLAHGSPSGAVELLEKMTGRKLKHMDKRNAREAMRKRKIWFESKCEIKKW